MKCALIQVDPATRVPANINLFAAYQGLSERGIECRFFAPDELVSALAGVVGEPIVCGVIPVVKAALGLLGKTPPSPLDYPLSLRSFLRRRVWATTLDVVRGDLGSPVFT